MNNTQTAGLIFGLSIIMSIPGGMAFANDSDLLPHGEIAVANGPGITEAYYGCATRRYAHGVLGDAIEGGCLIVKNAQGETRRYTLDDQFVFEDVTPRIADMDADGDNDVIVVQSDVRLGAALAIYSLNDSDNLELLATTPAIGRSFRWLAPAGIADFNADGQNDVAYVQTPHIGGILKVWSLNDGQLELLDEMSGVSNHSIGSTRVSLSRVVDHDDDGKPDLALPDQRSSEILVFSMQPGLEIIDRLSFSEAYFE